jgi:2-aminoethylphosphonate-pyruvate transaminase
MTSQKTQRQILLTPGPLTTTPSVKEAMLRDWGSRDSAFISITADIRSRLLALANASDTHSCALVQGSGTFAVEATLMTLLHREKHHALLLINGAYGRRIQKICEIAGIKHTVYETAEDTPPDTGAVRAKLQDNSDITHVVAVHCETTSGILNPLNEIADVTAAEKRKLIVDAMSSFGSLPIDLAKISAEAIIASANKCLEGVPGMGFALLEKAALSNTKGNASTLSLDLYDQVEYMDRTGQWRFTPPTHVVAALGMALEEHATEGGVTGRGRRYAENCQHLLDGLKNIGFELFLDDELQAPIIVTVRMPADPAFDFDRLYSLMNDKGIVLYPGAVTQEKSFRIGCIGQVYSEDMKRTLEAIRQALNKMGVSKPGLAP